MLYLRNSSLAVGYRINIYMGVGDNSGFRKRLYSRVTVSVTAKDLINNERMSWRGSKGNGE